MTAGEQRKAGTLVIALVAVLVASLAVIGWLAKENHDKGDDLAEAREQAQVLEQEKDASRDAIKAAASFVSRATTYSYKEGEHDFDWVGELSNPEVRKRYEPVVKELQAAIVKSRTTAKGSVLDSAARVISPEQVEVLAVVDQAITDGTGKATVEQPSITVTMKLVDGRWRVEELRFLNALGGE